MQAEGRAIKLADLAPAPIPDAENAADLYFEAYRILEALEFEGEDIFEWISKLDRPNAEPEIHVHVKALIDTPQFAEAMKVLDEATAREQCQFDLNYDSGADMLIPHVTPLLRISGLLRKQIQSQMEAGNLAEAGNTLKRLSVLASRLDQEPILISQLVRVANIALYKEALAYVLAHPETDTGFLDEMENQLTVFTREPFFPNWMEAERLYFLSVLRSENFSNLYGYGTL
ncbi:hypothetical protein P0Y35_03785 [Kiritimatiellaeota bacterium B1221]|nr:hypothetical protein [Kiritimatiellaeota bacterium B1221]